PPPALYTLSLHDALPIFLQLAGVPAGGAGGRAAGVRVHLVAAAGAARTTDGVGSEAAGARSVAGQHDAAPPGTGPGEVAGRPARSEEHTSELQSRENLVC